MEFDKIMLFDYLSTDSGRHVLDFFKCFKDRFFNRFKSEEFFNFVDGLLYLPLSRDFYGTPDDKFPLVFNRTKCADFGEFFSAFAVPFAEDDDLKKDAREFQGDMPQMSCNLFSHFPEYAFPYLLPAHFFKYVEICKLLGIHVAEMPKRNDHAMRCEYLFELFNDIREFRLAHGLAPEEMCALFYGFAPRFLVSYVNDAPLEANRVCIVGATREDAEASYLAHPRKDEIMYWQGNSEMTPGDIVLVYETSPYSRISSIWRAISPGFDDPFHYFSGKVFVGHPMKIPPISYGELAADPIWGKKGLVKAKMVGVSGNACTVEEYESLKKLIKRHDPGFQIGDLPEPPSYAQFYHPDLRVERDVEKVLLEPLLGKLGFSDKDWVRQLELRMGRGTHVFPDYAIKVSGDSDNRTAECVFEAKYRIPSIKQLRVDFGQVKSYALRLQSKILGLVALEGVWISMLAEGFTFDKLHKFTWEELARPEQMSKLRKLFRSALSLTGC